MALIVPITWADTPLPEMLPMALTIDSAPWVACDEIEPNLRTDWERADH